MSSPLVSVIVPNYNHHLYLPERIESILLQEFQDFELILLDDCSPDDSVEIFERYRSNPKVSHICVNGQNSGSTFKQWEKGISLARGKYIWIAESDDSADPRLLGSIVNALERYPSAVVGFCSTVVIDSEDRALDINIPDELLSHLVSTDAEDTKNTVQAFAKLFKDAVQDAVKDKLKGNPPKRGTGGKGTVTREQILAIKNPSERQRMIAEHMDLFE